MKASSDNRLIGPRNKRQADFIRFFLNGSGYNATKAAVMAGYSEKTAYSIGHQLRRKPHIKAAIEIGFIMQCYDIRRSGAGSRWPAQTVHDLIQEYLKNT